MITKRSFSAHSTLTAYFLSFIVYCVLCINYCVSLVSCFLSPVSSRQSPVLRRLFFVSYCLLFIVYCLISPSHVLAVGEFTENYDVQYAVAPSGVTIVTQNVSLTNKKTNLYPQKYSILIDSVHIKNVIAYDNGGIIKPQITQKDNRTEIVLQFNEKIVGMGKSLKFSLRYENTDIAQKNGEIWEINIPGVADGPDLENYFVSISVPPTFGANAYMSPPPAGGNKWTKDQMIRGGVSAAYGNVQQFESTLSYYLDNPTVTTKTMEIALPPDTAYQQISIQSLDPKPKTVVKDIDGNWLAQYDVSAQSNTSISAKVNIKVFLHPNDSFVTQPVDSSLYTAPAKYWETQDPKIMELASQYKTPREIYEYVVRTLSYDYGRVNKSPIRKGAVQALSTPESAICMEFTDVFIALARAAGIPAREAVGYAYTTNAKLRPLSLSTDVLHAWPEYYDTESKIWIPVDPTWADTTGGVNYFDKLDFNHIVFSYYGKSSDYPYPAGFYKKAGSTTKDVFVQFTQGKQAEKTGKLAISYLFPKTITSGITGSGSVTIENISEVAISGVTATIQSAPVDVFITKLIPDLPPYANYTIPISMHIPNSFTKNFGMIVTTAGDESMRFDFIIVPFIYTFSVPIIAITIVVVLLVGLMVWERVWKH